VVITVRKKKGQKKPVKKTTKGAPKKAAKVRSRKRAGVKKEKTDFRARFMENILVKKGELEKTLEHLMDSQKEYDVQLSGGDFIEEFDRAQREISASRYYPLIERKTKELKNIERLIKRISKEDKFGLCEECGKRIPKRRLLIIPEATLCVDCQRELEKMDYQKGVEARLSTDFGQRKEMDWRGPGDFGESGYMVTKKQGEGFSVDDLNGTEVENNPEGK